MTLQDTLFNQLNLSTIPEIQCRYIAHKLEDLNITQILSIHYINNNSYIVKTNTGEFIVDLPLIPIPYCEINRVAQSLRPCKINKISITIE